MIIGSKNCSLTKEFRPVQFQGLTIKIGLFNWNTTGIFSTVKTHTGSGTHCPHLVSSPQEVTPNRKLPFSSKGCVYW